MDKARLAVLEEFNRIYGTELKPSDSKDLNIRPSYKLATDETHIMYLAYDHSVSTWIRIWFIVDTNDQVIGIDSVKINHTMSTVDDLISLSSASEEDKLITKLKYL